MNSWQTLEIDPTSEISTIKRAYAKKLKIHHPEDDPQGFQLLREAYDNALKYAKNSQSQRIENNVLIEDNNDLLKKIEIQNIFIEENYDSKTEYSNYNLHKVNIKNDFIDITVNYEQLQEEFLKNVSALYTDFFSRIEEKNWEELLNADIMWKLEYKELINKKMLVFLMDHHYLPKNIWQLLNANFNWDEEENYLYSCYPENFTKYLFKQIRQERVFRYCYFNKSAEIDYEEYLKYREEAFTALFSNQLRIAKEYIFLAYKMYPYDPELLCMKGEYHLRMREKRKASATFKNAIRINPDDIEIYYFKAVLMFNNYKYAEVIKTCKHIQPQMSNDFELSYILGKSYIQVGKLYKAKEVFLRNLKIRASDMETRRCLKQISNQFEKRLEKHTFNLRLRRELKQTYQALGEPINEEIMKISFIDFLKMFFYICIGIALLIGTGIVLVISKGGAIIPTILVSVYGYREYKK